MCFMSEACYYLLVYAIENEGLYFQAPVVIELEIASVQLGVSDCDISLALIF